MKRLDCKTGDAAFQRWEEYVARAPNITSKGRSSAPYGEMVHGGHTWAERHLALIVSGRGWAEGEGGERVQLRAGEGAAWEPGEWYAFGLCRGAEAVRVGADDLSVTEFCDTTANEDEAS